MFYFFYFFYRNEAAKLANQEESSNVAIKQRVLVLGAGLVSGPLVEYLTRDKSLKLTAGMILKSLNFFYLSLICRRL